MTSVPNKIAKNGPSGSSLLPHPPDRHVDPQIEMYTNVVDGEEGVPRMIRETSGWDVYNNEARKVDIEMVKDWTGSLNFLLLFAAIFSAILTAFIIDSKKLLEQDANEALLDVMIFYTSNLANGSHTMYNRPTFEASSSAVAINALFFASLSASLIAALASVVALQWVAEYDGAISRGGSSPEDRAMRRHYLLAGVTVWKMGQIIAALPLLLHFSAFLFFSGLILWMWGLHQTIGLVVALGAIIAGLFYVSSTAIAAIFTSAPFQTPLSRWIYYLVYLMFARVTRFRLIPAWPRHQSSIYTLFHRRRDIAIQKAQSLKMEAVVWLANRVNLSQDSYRRLLLLVSELPGLDPDALASPSFRDAPWSTIFDLLGWRYLRILQERPISPEETRDFEILAQCYNLNIIREIVQPKLPLEYITESTNAEYWSQHRDKVNDTWNANLSHAQPNSFFLIFRDVPPPSKGTLRELEMTAQLARWRNSSNQTPEIWKLVFNEADEYSDTFLSACVLCFSQFVGAQRWFLRDHEGRAPYVFIFHQIVQTLQNNTGRLPFNVLKSLSRAFECVVTGYREHDAMPARLGSPLWYGERLHQLPTEDQTLHYDFLLLLARTIQSSPADQRRHRVLEVVTMIWLSPSIPITREWREMDSRFIWDEVPRTMVMEWITFAHKVPGILEILRHLAEAQASNQEIGHLWRKSPASSDHDPHFLEALQTFDRLISDGCTPAEHHTVITAVCQDLEFDQSGTLPDYFTEARLQVFAKLKDPCLRLLAACARGTGHRKALAPVLESTEMLEDSWARVEEYLFRCYASNVSPHLLQLQASLWHLYPGAKDICKRALKEPQMLSHLERVFAYPIKCHHVDTDSHLLVHVFEQVPTCYLHNAASFGIIEMSNYLAVPPLLATLCLYDSHKDWLQKQLLQTAGKECITQLLQMCHTARTSQTSLLQILLNLSWDLPRAWSGIVSVDDLAILVVCIVQALSLPPEHGSTFILRQIALSIRYSDDKVMIDTSKWDLRIATLRRVEETYSLLMSTLAERMIFGRQNTRRVSCARTHSACCPADGWLSIHVE